MKPVIYTIGHSTKPLPEFLDALASHGVKVLADVRSIPRSRRNPQYDQEALKQSLSEAGIAYVWLEALGGRRRALALADSPNGGWRNESFRGYADYLQTPAFAAGLAELKGLARKPTAFMCAEAVPWRCHRSLIADVLTAQGWEVFNIFDHNTAKLHVLNPMARPQGDTLIYPPAQEPLL